jgi:hypothetical protein
MKLTKKQKEILKGYGWDLVTASEDGEEQNCSWVSITPEDGIVYQEVISHFELTGDSDCIKLLVIATIEEQEE